MHANSLLFLLLLLLLSPSPSSLSFFLGRDRPVWEPTSCSWVQSLKFSFVAAVALRPPLGTGRHFAFFPLRSLLLFLSLLSSQLAYFPFRRMTRRIRFKLWLVREREWLQSRSWKFKIQLFSWPSSSSASYINSLSILFNCNSHKTAKAQFLVRIFLLLLSSNQMTRQVYFNFNCLTWPLWLRKKFTI